MFYKNNTNKKRVPESIGEYLTTLALAILIMDDCAKVGKNLKFCTNSFSYNECLILIKALNDNFNIKSSVQLAGANNQYIIYIWKGSMDNLKNIVSAYIIPAMNINYIKHKLYIVIWCYIKQFLLKIYSIAI